MTIISSLLTEEDVYLFKEGKHFRLYDKLGAHLLSIDNQQGVHFAVWAPNARSVSVIGDFNGWDPRSHPLNIRWDSSGIWEGFVPHIQQGAIYKYHIVSKLKNFTVDKGDPFAVSWEIPPKTASVVWDLGYDWNEKEWMQNRDDLNHLDAPVSVYELHYPSWRRKPEEGNRSLSYREMAEILPPYILEMGFTHVEFLPLMEHPFLGSWGYQKVGYFAPSSRYGTPQDFMFLIETLHQKGIGVILDWVPSHFPSDEHGLCYFDGTHLFEHEDPKRGFHPDWRSYLFNYGRNEVRAFLISSAMFWCDRYHIDGLRMDAVASMLYLDYSRQAGEWVPNIYGGNENLEAVDFIKQLNRAVYERYPYMQTIAEESTAWPMVSRPTYLGGLGFGMKWNMGWMHDTLSYFSKDPVYRKFHHNELLFSLIYAFSENFLLPLSHDEVVHGKSSLLGKMPGNDWEKFANLRLLLGYMWAHPGKKLLFMGGEIGQWTEWNHDSSVEWHLLDYDPHQQIQKWVKDLNAVYRSEPALNGQDFSNQGFEWVDIADANQSVVSFVRKGKLLNQDLLIICNFTPLPRHYYKLGVSSKGTWEEVLNSDSAYYGGSNLGNLGAVKTRPIPYHGKDYTLSLTLPPLAILIFKSTVQ
ncbi:MAG: 1,4-alpha-glucan branching protein GlgB [Waddliaceae bacterium]